jgi:hypothetical protein
MQKPNPAVRVISKTGLVVLMLCAAFGMMLGAPRNAAGQEVLTRQLPPLDANAVVAPCGDWTGILSNSTVSTLSPNGDVTTISNVTGAVAVFSDGGRCSVIEAGHGIVDIESASAGSALRVLSGTLPDIITAATAGADRSVWFGIEGSDQLGMIRKDGTVRYFDFPEGDPPIGTLRCAGLQVAPKLSKTPILTKDVQLLSSAGNYVWALRGSMPLNAEAYALRFDPVSLAYERIGLGPAERFAGLIALSDGRAVVLTLADHVMLIGSTRIEMQWDLPGVPRYHAPPFRLNMVTGSKDTVYLAAVKDGALWSLSMASGMLTRKGVFPSRPAWIYVIGKRLIAIDTERSTFMSAQL